VQGDWHRRCSFRMRFGHDYTASATAEYIVVEPAAGSDFGRRALPIASTVALLVVFGYCMSVAWDVLHDLGRVSLADLTQALRVVSVRDAILCVVGYRVGRELLVALLQRRTAR
jgi:hypothetical protein